MKYRSNLWLFLYTSGLLFYLQIRLPDAIIWILTTVFVGENRFNVFLLLKILQERTGRW